MERKSPTHEVIAISSAVIGHAQLTRALNAFRKGIQRRALTAPWNLSKTVEFDLVQGDLNYRMQVTRSGQNTYSISLNKGKTTVEVHELGMECKGDVMVVYRRLRSSGYKRCSVEETYDTFKVKIDGQLTVFKKNNDPRIVKSLYVGKLLGYKRNNGDFISEGETLAVLESSGSNFAIQRKIQGYLEQALCEGAPLYPGTVIARILPSTTDSCSPRQFTETFLEWAEPMSEETNLSELKKFNNCYKTCTDILNGSIPAESNFHPDILVDELFDCLSVPSLGHSSLKFVLADPTLKMQPLFVPYLKRIEQILRKQEVSNFREILQIMNEFFGSVPPDAVEMTKLIYEPLRETCKKFLEGSESHRTCIVSSLLKQYLECELSFKGHSYNHAVVMLMKQNSSNSYRLLEIIHSHTQLEMKNKFLVALLKRVGHDSTHLVPALLDSLREVADLCQTGVVAAECHRLLGIAHV